MGKGLLWWLAELILIGIANSILRDLQYEVASKRERWENQYEELEQEVVAQQLVLEDEIFSAQEDVSFHEIRALHSQSVELADRVYSLLGDSRETLDAMGNAIVDAAKQRKILQQRRKEVAYGDRQSIQDEIEGLIELRDDILIPDKDTVKEQRNSLLQKVQSLNKQTAMLRDMKEEIRLEEKETKKKKRRATGVVKFYNSEKQFGFIKSDSSERDVYVNVKQLQNTNSLKAGDHVTFVIMSGEKPWASQVETTNEVETE